MTGWKRVLGWINSMDPVIDGGMMVERFKVRRVAVASSTISRHLVSREILLAEKEVLVEKPMALNSKDAETMLEIAEKERRILMASFDRIQ
jgi:predicted dehydrogenase